MRGPRFYRQSPEHAHSDPTALDRKAETLTGQAGRELDRLLRAIRDLKAWEATGHLVPAVDRFKVILADAESALKGLTTALDKAIADYAAGDGLDAPLVLTIDGPPVLDAVADRMRAFFRDTFGADVAITAWPEADLDQSIAERREAALERMRGRVRGVKQHLTEV